MDFLGLRNLTILSRTVQLIQQTTGKAIDPLKFPLDDKEAYALLQRGETKGVFQLESGGIRDLLQRMKPDHFTDIIATAALYRPGPLEGGMVDDYVNIKHGRQEPEYKHPVLKEVLEETNSIMVYQEQHGSSTDLGKSRWPTRTPALRQSAKRRRHSLHRTMMPSSPEVLRMDYLRKMRKTSGI